jgi:CHAD domain-containing protein
VVLRKLRTLFWAYRPLFDRAFADDPGRFFPYLAKTAGRTRDWDILIQWLSERHGGESLPLDALRAARCDAMKASRAKLADAGIGHALHAALDEASRELAARYGRVALHRFARRRTAEARKSLRKRKRVRRARQAAQSDDASLHDVRKAAKKLRYLVEFFAPSLLETDQVCE